MATSGSNFWAAGLIKTLNDTKNHIISSNIGVVINDKYPKAKHHFLVLPRDDIPSIFHLSQKHLPVLEELHLLGLNVIEIKGQKVEDFKIGFHAQPSMQRLHLHVISKDFVSDFLKTKKHWNSFNTKLFMPYEGGLILSTIQLKSVKDLFIYDKNFAALFKELTEQGSIKRLEKIEVNKLAAMELSCNQCDYKANNMPDLKQHLLKHTKNKELKSEMDLNDDF